MDNNQSTKTFSPEPRERAVRMVFDPRGKDATQWVAKVPVGAKIDCNTETLHHWVRRFKRDVAASPGKLGFPLISP